MTMNLWIEVHVIPMGFKVVKVTAEPGNWRREGQNKEQFYLTSVKPPPLYSAAAETKNRKITRSWYPPGTGVVTVSVRHPQQDVNTWLIKAALARSLPSAESLYFADVRVRALVMTKG